MIFNQNPSQLFVGGEEISELYVDGYLVWKKPNADRPWITKVWYEDDSGNSGYREFDIRGEFIYTMILPDKTDNFGMPLFGFFGWVTKIEFGNQVTSIDEAGTSGSAPHKLSQVNIPDSVTELRLQAFNQSKISEIQLPNNLTLIGDLAFGSCVNLTEITIPHNVRKIGWEAFYYCKNLKKMYYDGTLSEWNAIEKGRDWNLRTHSDFKVICLR